MYRFLTSRSLRNHASVFLLALVITAAGCQSSSPTRAMQEIKGVMDAQVAAWNSGDVEGFLGGYIKSPDLIFASRGTFTRGWDPLLERYQVAYPHGNMGRLRFDGVEINRVGDDTAWVVGSWWLDLQDSSPHGVFTLVLRKTDEGWRIVHDHSSGVDVPATDAD
jgi:uncharacterized protein (TIGR02246 family)